MEKVCEKCGQKFVTNKANALYCSFTCRQAAQRDSARERARKKRASIAGKTIVCACGKLFVPRDGRQKFCSPDCPAKKKSHNYPEEFSKPERKTKVARSPVGLDQALKDLKKYNAEHGTLLSYGQYMAMIERK